MMNLGWMAASVGLLAMAPAPGVSGPASAGARLEQAARRPVWPHEAPRPRPIPVRPPGELAGAGFHIQRDPVSGLVERAAGGRVAWLPSAERIAGGVAGEVPRGAARRERLVELAFGFVRDHGDLFPIAREDLALDEDGSVSVEAAELDVVRLRILEGGVPVLGGQIVLVLRHGDLVYFGSSHGPPGARARDSSAAGREPALRSAGEALERALQAARLERAEVIPRPGRRDRFVLPTTGPDGPFRPLVQAARFALRDSPDEEWEAWVDARTGDTLALFPVAHQGCPSLPQGTPARVTGGVRPALGNEAEVPLPLPGVDLGGGAWADGKGRFLYTGAERESRLAGRHARVNCLICKNPESPVARSGETGTVDFGLGPAGSPDSLGNGSSNPAARSAYHHVTTARSLAAKWLAGSLSFLDQQLEIQVNGANSCNALWTGSAIKLFQSSGECRNTALVRDVVVHEWAHALDDFDGTGISDSALSEGSSDVFAMLLDHGSCFAESMYLALPPVPPSQTCTGLRELDEKAPGLVHRPATLTLQDNDCGGGAHCRGEIYGQAAWHLARDLATGLSYGDGSPVGPALGEDLAFETLERLYMLSRPLAETLDPEAAGLSIYDAYMIADLEPGGARPRGRQINDAFAHHGLQEVPGIAGSAGAPGPPDPPILGYQLLLDEGEPWLELRWADVAASRYRVLRRRVGGPRAFEAVSDPVEDDGRPAYTLADPGLENGAGYEYLVLAEGVHGSWSPGLSRVSVEVGFAELVIASHQEADPVPGGDGDGILEPGEFFEIQLDIAERAGIRGARNVRAAVASLDPQVRVASGPVPGFGDVPPLGSARASAPLRLYIDPAHPCQGDIPLVVTLQSDDQGCLLRPIKVRLPAAACPSTQRSDVRFVRARVLDDGRNPDCSDHDMVLDAGEQARLGVTVENRGAAAASEVEVVLATRENAIVFASGSAASLGAPLAPGAQATLDFEVLAGELGCSLEVPFQVRVEAPENLVPDSGSFTLVTEQDQGQATVLWDFETGAQGFTAEEPWVLSRLRSNPDDRGQSFHAGAVPNACASLVSPPVSLHPTEPATLTLASWYALQGVFQAKYWDGVNVWIRRSTGSELLRPSGGRDYDGSLGRLVLCETGNPAWASDSRGRSWARTSFDLSPYRGETVQLELHYATDNNSTAEGFYLDDVTVENALAPVCDGLSCEGDPACSTPEMLLRATSLGCAGDAVRFQADFDYFGLGSFTYEWDFGDGVRLPTGVPDAPVEHRYRLPSTYAARLWARLESNPLCTTSATTVVPVAARPLADAGPDVVAPARIGVPGFPGLDYLWVPAAGLDVPQLPQPYADPGRTTEYCVNVSDPASGCTARDCTLARVPSACGLTADDVKRLLVRRGGLDLQGHWTAVPLAAGYTVFRMTDRDAIPTVEAVNTRAEAISGGTSTGFDDPGAVAAPPSRPFLYFYQVVPLCP